MTISSETIRQTFNAPITAGDPNTIPFSFTVNTQVKAYTMVANVKTDLQLTSDFTITSTTTNHGNLLLNSTLSAGTLTIYRVTVNEQQTIYSSTGKFPAISHEQALDTLTRQSQEQADAISRSISVPLDTSVEFNAGLPSPTANKALIFNADGSGFTVSTDDYEDQAADAAASAAIATAQVELATTQAGISTTQAEISAVQAGLAGTYASNASASAASASGYRVKEVLDKTLSSVSWSKVGDFYEQEISDALITADSSVGVVPQKAYKSIVDAAQFADETDSSTGSVKVYCMNEPTGDIVVTLLITEKLV